MDDTVIKEKAVETLEIEAAAVKRLTERIDEEFVAAVNCILACKARVIVTGMGKSGHVGRKIAATLASTGTPSFFLHPAEAFHGDLGMVTEQDVVIAISNTVRINPNHFFIFPSPFVMFDTLIIHREDDAGYIIYPF